MTQHEIYDDEFFFRLLTNDDEAISFAQSIGLLKQSIICCGTEVFAKKRLHTTNSSYTFKCTQRICRKEVSLRKDSFFFLNPNLE
jgi:hypothetical protein